MMLLNFPSIKINYWNTFAQPTPNAANGIFDNATFAVTLKYSKKFWRSLKMLITKH